MFEAQGSISSILENVRIRWGGEKEKKRGGIERMKMRIFFFYTIQQLLLNVLVFLDFYLTLISWELSKYYT